MFVHTLFNRLPAATHFLAFFLCAGILAAQSLVMVSGNGQLVDAQFPSTQPLVVQAKDAGGHPASGVAVAWAITDGGGSIVFPTTTTDANGMASASFQAGTLTQLDSFVPSTVTATSASGKVTFVITTIPTLGSSTSSVQIAFDKPDIGSTLAAQSGTTLTGAVVVHVFASAGFSPGPIPNVGLRVANNQNLSATPPAACKGANGLVLTDANGQATCDLVVSGPPGTTQLVGIIGELVQNPVFNLQITPGVTCTFTLSSTGQSFSSAGGTGTVNVNTSSGCGWTATSNSNFISITAGATGTGPGSVSYSVAANSGAGRSGTLTIAGQTFTVNQGVAAPGGLAITTQNLPVGTVNSAYSTTLTATGGQPPYTWSVAGTLPNGLTLATGTGQIGGTPTASGSFGFSITVKDNAGATQSQNFTIIINSTTSSGFSISNASFPNGVVNQSYSQVLLSSGGCVSPFAPRPIFSLASGTLPTGLGIQPNSDGTQSLTGKPTVTGTFNFTLSAKDACANIASRSFSIVVTGAPGNQQMLVSPTSLTFNVQLGSVASPADQTISISSDSGTLNVSTAISTNSGGSWLVVRNTPNTTPAQLVVGVANFSSLKPGPYTGSITIGSQAANSPVIVNVTLNVAAAPPLQIISPTSFTINAVASTAANLTNESIVLASGSVPLHFTAQATTATGGPWLIVGPTQGDTPATLTATVNSGGLSVGTYNGTVQITPTGGTPLSVSITLIVAQPKPSLTAVTNAASFLSGPVAPGEIVTLFGSAIGPSPLVTYRITEFGRLDTSVGDTQVFFDGFAASIVYTSADKVSVIVPYEVAGNPNTTVFIQYLGQRSNAMTVPVADAAPGIFVLDTSGQGAILNQDTGVNSSANGAEPGSVISIFATGEGQTDPAGVDGSITGSVLRKPLLSVTVQIGGQNAEVSYAGAAPGEPAGVLQVNAKIPAGVPRGAPAPVVITIGTASSQSGVTVAIKP